MNGSEGPNGVIEIQKFKVTLKQDIYKKFGLYVMVDKVAKTGKLEFKEGPKTLVDLNAQVTMDSNNYGLKTKLSFPKTSGNVLK